MRKDDIAALVGAEVAVEWPGYEAHVGFGGGPAIVRARVLSAPVRWNSGTERHPQWNSGARVALMAPLRVGLATTAGFRELEVGHETNVPSRQILRAWAGDDAYASSGSHHGVSDAERESERAQRYVEQDAIREALTRLGLREREGSFGEGDFELKGGDVVLQRPAFTAWLRRVDPVVVAGDAIEEYAQGVDASRAAHELAKANVLREVEQGLAVSDAELEPSPEDQYAQDFDAAADRAMRSGGAGPV